MPHLAAFREGWTNERLADFLLSRIAFIARPGTTADDIGSDFLCTLFERSGPANTEHLLPRSPFVVQAKSSGLRLSLTKHIGYLARLEVPYFVAIPDRQRMWLRLYSGRYLPYLFALRGPNLETLSARLTRKTATTTRGLKAAVSGPSRRPIVAMPRIATLRAAAQVDELKTATAQVEAECREVALNNHHRLVNQFVFAFNEGAVRTVLAGPGSAQVFRRNFADRLLEYCRNLIWLLRNRSSAVSKKEVGEILTVIATISPRLPASPALDRAVRSLRKHA